MHMNLPPTTPKNPHHTQNPKPQTRKWCFRCESCKTKLSTGTGNYRITNGKNFCHICYDKLFNLAKKQKYSVFGMTEEQQSKLVKSASKESALSWHRQSAPSLVSGWGDAAKTPSGKAVLLPNEEALVVTVSGHRPPCMRHTDPALAAQSRAFGLKSRSHNCHPLPD